MTEATKWEHKAVRAATLEELVVKLDEFGQQNWEVVNFYYGESLGDPDEKEFDDGDEFDDDDEFELVS